MLTIALLCLLAVPLLVLTAGQLGWLQGQRPADLGVHNGRLKGLSSTPNSVSSQAHLYPTHPQAPYAAVDPLPIKPAGISASLASLTRVLKAMPGVVVIDEQPDYLYAQAQTRWLNFTDDLEFWVDPERQVIEVRSASRLGRKDFGVNRDRIESLRKRYLLP